GVAEAGGRPGMRGTFLGARGRGALGPCGGDFCARGHIRAIARAVGADPGPLIAAYDAAHQAPSPVPAAELFGPAGLVKIRERHRVPWAGMLGLALVAVLGLVAYYVIAGSHHSSAAPAAARAGLHRAIHRHPHRAAPARTASTRAANRYARMVAIRLVAVEDCWVEFTTPVGGYLSQTVVAAGTSRTWIFRHAVDMRLGDPGDVKLTVDG